MIGILALVLFVLLLAVGGERGASSILTLAGNIFVLTVTIFLLAGGFPPILLTFLAGTVISYLTLIKQNGKNKKTGAAFLATAAVMLLLLPAVYLVVWKTNGGGLNEIQAIQEDVMYYYNVDLRIRMLSIAVCINLLSVLGAVLDTALSITSSVHEVAVHRPELTRQELFFSGMRIGKEITGTTVNTLLFAYLGGSLLLFAYIKTGKYTVETILNSKFLFQDLSVMLFGGIACLAAVPVSSVCGAQMTAKNIKKNQVQN
ncbi:YibE/F family protein [Suipraeoptans intestinalis]|uniref:YibE/F family protein n=1 Tax=Suipraeoptans intestinalis TaxID=2606628 RepID=UPI0023F4BE2C|nr:YibE/F family protein [Suipraeoptans intestinalis]MDD7770608.1 YibE/F family protein [Suipraeoptans intestinalis]